VQKTGKWRDCEEGIERALNPGSSLVLAKKRTECLKVIITKGGTPQGLREIQEERRLNH